MHFIYILLLQLYWLSFFVIGCGVLTLLGKKNIFVRDLSNSPVSQVFFTASCLGLTSQLAYIIPGYFFGWPLSLFALYYALTVAASVLILLKRRKPIIVNLRKRWHLQDVTAISIFLGLVIALGCFFSLKTGSLVDGDPRVFVSIIHQWLATGHLSFDDPYFGGNGIMNIGYSTNVLFALRALGAYLTGMSAVNVWFYSGAFMLLMMWSGFYSLCRHFLPAYLHKTWPAAITALLPFFMSRIVRDVSLPTVTALMWVCLFIIGLKIYLVKRSYFLLVVSCALLAATHSLNAAIAGMFLVFFGASLLVMKSLNLKQAICLIGCAGILFLPMICALFFPRYIADYQLQAAWPIQTITGLPIVKVPRFFSSPIFIAIDLLVIVYICLHKFVGNNSLLKIFYALIGVAVVLGYDPKIAGVLGLLFILINAKGKPVKILISTLIVFYVFMAFNPIVVAALQDKLPFWGFQRFADFNTLHFIAPIIGIMYFIYLPLKVFKINNAEIKSSYAVIIIYLGAIPFLTGVPLRMPWDQGYPIKTQVAQLARLDTIQAMKPYVEGQMIVSNDPDILTSIPNVMQANFISLPNEGPSPLANRFKRDACYKKITSELAEKDVVNAGVGVVMVRVNEHDAFVRLAASRPFLKHYASVDGYKIYKVTSRLQPQQHAACSIPYQQ